MKVKELRELLNNMSPEHDDEVICIITDKIGFGGNQVVNVETAYSGFDWNSGLFMIQPSQDLIDVIKPPININDMEVLDPEYVDIVNKNFNDLLEL